MPDTAILQTSLSRWPVRRGKVRDIYDLGSQLLLLAISTFDLDRLPFDWVLPTGIPDKGRVLTELSAFWFDLLKEPNQMLPVDAGILADLPQEDQRLLAGRSMWVRRATVVPIECVVRGYLRQEGRAGPNIKNRGRLCGIRLPSGLVESSLLPEPIFTPATKAESGHDVNISFDEMASRIGRKLAEGNLRGAAVRWRFTPGARSTRGSGAFF